MWREYRKFPHTPTLVFPIVHILHQYSIFVVINYSSYYIQLSLAFTKIPLSAPGSYPGQDPRLPSHVSLGCSQSCFVFDDPDSFNKSRWTWIHDITPTIFPWPWIVRSNVQFLSLYWPKPKGPSSDLRLPRAECKSTPRCGQSIDTNPDRLMTDAIFLTTMLGHKNNNETPLVLLCSSQSTFTYSISQSHPNNSDGWSDQERCRHSWMPRTLVWTYSTAWCSRRVVVSSTDISCVCGPVLLWRAGPLSALLSSSLQCWVSCLYMVIF